MNAAHAETGGSFENADDKRTAILSVYGMGLMLLSVKKSSLVLSLFIYHVIECFTSQIAS
jgi:hypothetical protein